jgi:hypothetical protein
MYTGLHVKKPLFLSELSMKLEFSQQIFKKKKSTSTKFHENPLIESCDFPCRRTYMTKLIVAFSYFANASRKE